jgi:hypothetical protein
MFKIQRKFVESCLLIILLITLFLLASLTATAKELTYAQDFRGESLGSKQSKLQTTKCPHCMV